MLAGNVKRTVYLGLSTLLLFLLTACPGAQTPVEAIDVTGTWIGVYGDLGDDARQVPITAELEQTNAELGGTGYFGPVIPGADISGPITGSVAGSTVIFAFSFLAGSDGETATYEFTGTVDGEILEGTVAAGLNGEALEPQGRFRLERQ